MLRCDTSSILLLLVVVVVVVLVSSSASHQVMPCFFIDDGNSVLHWCAVESTGGVSQEFISGVIGGHFRAGLPRPFGITVVLLKSSEFTRGFSEKPPFGLILDSTVGRAASRCNGATQVVTLFL